MTALIARHERSLMRVALHWSICRDDALDAYQRALEIYMRRLDTLDPATEIAWMRVVVKHEALAIRRERADSLPFDELEYDAGSADEQRPVDDLLAGRERVERSAEALRRIKPDEARALVLKAQGLSYREIGEALSWTYTKVNRCLTEGRAHFLAAYAEIEAGEACERFAPTLAALIAGTATADALLELRPHIRNCAACRARVRELHATRLGRLTALWPLPALVAPLRWVTGHFGDGAVTAPAPAGGLPHGIVVTSPDGAVADGAAADDFAPLHDIPDLYDAIARLDLPTRAATPRDPGRLLELKAQAYQWLHRFQASDVATNAQLAASAGGGGRIATVGAVIGLCLSGLGAGAVCVVSVVTQPNTPAPHRPPIHTPTAHEQSRDLRSARHRIPREPHSPAATRDNAPGTMPHEPDGSSSSGRPRRSKVPRVPAAAKEFDVEERAEPASDTGNAVQSAVGAPNSASDFEGAVQSTAPHTHTLPTSNATAESEFGG